MKMEDNKTIKCGHCGVYFTIREKDTLERNVEIEGGFFNSIRHSKEIHAEVCPKCNKLNIHYLQWSITEDPEFPHREPYFQELYPGSIRSKQISQYAPKFVQDSYNSASKTLHVCALASAVMARRCLQGILRDKGYVYKTLHAEINSALEHSKKNNILSSYLEDHLDSIRKYGNYSAHPEEFNGEIFMVEQDEAAFCLELCYELAEIYYTRPEKAKQIRKRLEDLEAEKRDKSTNIKK